MKTQLSSRFLRLGVVPIVTTVLLLPFLGVHAQDRTWIGGTGNWNTAGNWGPSGVPVAGDNVLIDGGNGTDSVVTLNTTPPNLGNLTISTGDTLQKTGTSAYIFTVNGTFSNSGSYLQTNASGQLNMTLNGSGLTHSNASSGLIENSGIAGLIIQMHTLSDQPGGTFNNAGTMRSTAGVLDFRWRTAGTGTGALLNNTGTIEAVGSSATVRLTPSTGSIAGALNNTGGILRSTSGGTLEIWGGPTISNGTMSIGASSFLSLGDASQAIGGLIFSNVAVTANGTTNLRQAYTTFNSSGTQSATFSSGSFANNGVLNVSNTSSAPLASISSNDVTFTSNTTFTNNGTINLTNNATGSVGTGTKNATFQVASGSTFTNAGSILVSHTSVVANTNARFLVNNGASGANNFTNGGNVTISGSAASFLVQNGRDYVQSATGTTTLLQNGGTLGASNVSITGGSLGGIGTVNGAISIGANGTLFAGSGTTNGNLTVSTVSLADGADLAFNLTSTAAYSRVLGTSMTLANGTYTITLNGVGTQAINLNDAFTLFNGTVNNFAGATFNIVNNTNWSGGWQVSEGSLIVTAVPEPTTWLLLTASLTALLIFRRRRPAL